MSKEMNGIHFPVVSNSTEKSELGPYLEPEVPVPFFCLCHHTVFFFLSQAQILNETLQMFHFKLADVAPYTLSLFYSQIKKPKMSVLIFLF